MRYLIFLLLASIQCLAQDNHPPSVHDPVMAKQGDTYYIFATGYGISTWSSTDFQHWKEGPPVFANPPKWALDAVPGFKGHIWAPDISYYQSQYYLYYSISTFGKNRSSIGLATNVTLDPADPRYHWTDHGAVISSVPGKTPWNAIDPNLAIGEKDTPYLAFGSFWNGIQLVRLRKDRIHLAEAPSKAITLASHKKDPGSSGDNAIEGAFIFKKGGYYYLFASIDYCCKGPQSTYKMIVGRSKSLKGPYLDNQGNDLRKGGGHILLAGDTDWYGVGHNAVFHDPKSGIDYLIFHGYDAHENGRPKLRIEPLIWNPDGWPTIQPNTSLQ
ncbi:arabinan endo-1,5-alpha-L-arabinosidase [bacterium A37T11]|nr:arabinan endo-1,5-alpha-L-arabinosidase [bacterium A37T11]